MHFASDTGHDNQENIFPGTEGQKVTELIKPDFWSAMLSGKILMKGGKYEN